MKFPAELKDFIENAPWIFAKTYADTWPHHYMLRKQVDDNLFVRTVKHIRTYGTEGAFYTKTYLYYFEDGLVYWTMGNPVEKTILINRCPEENTYEARLKAGTLPTGKAK